MDSNYWGIWVVPLGVMIGFGPALLVWLRIECRARPNPKRPLTRGQAADAPPVAHR